jgi:hypothetical protein
MNLGMAKRIIFILITLVILVVVIAGIISIFRWVSPKSAYVFNTNSRTVIKQVQSLNRLETAQFTIEKVIDAGTNGNIFQQFLFGDKLLLIAQGDVIAGVDMTKVKENDIQIDNNAVRLTLPSPEILIATLNNDQTRVYDRKTGLLTKGDKDLEAKAREQATKIIRQAACDGHILDTASTNARNQLTALLKSLGFATVIITIPQTSCS